SEAMYQNLVVKGQGGAQPESVHHCEFPEPKEALIDADLSADMEALLDLVSLGRAARSSAKINVRQPLAEVKGQTSDIRHQRAVERFADQIMEELNIKQVHLHDAKQGELLRYDVRANLKTLGPKFGPRLKEIQEAVSKADHSALAKKVLAGEPIEIATANG